jgi:predicted nucleic acid-binding protein
MRLVIDANILFSILIKEGYASELFFRHELYAPDYLLSEFSKYEGYLLQKTHRPIDEFGELLDVLSRNITFVGSAEYSSFLDAASGFSPDPFDVKYLALAIMLDCPIWSNDLRLKTGQDKVLVITTAELGQMRQYQ